MYSEFINYIPTSIRLDICNLCQLNCAACWVREEEELIKKEGGGFGYVKFETYKDFVDRHPFIEEIELSNNGEIFLNPDLLEIIMYSHQKNIRLLAENGVNLNYLPNEIAEALVKFQVLRMRVSIDGASPETYSIYRRKGDFNKVIENIKKINYYKEKYNSIFPILSYKFIVFGHNEHEIEKAKQLAKELKMEMMFAVNAVPEYSPIKNIEKVIQSTNLKVFNDCENYYNTYIQNPSRHWFYCKDLFIHPQINWDGEFLGCCARLRKGFEVNNVFEDGLIKTLQNEKIIYAKKLLTDLSVEPRYDIACIYCHIFKFLRDNKLTILPVI